MSQIEHIGTAHTHTHTPTPASRVISVRISSFASCNTVRLLVPEWLVFFLFLSVACLGCGIERSDSRDGLEQRRDEKKEIIFERRHGGARFVPTWAYVDSLILEICSNKLPLK